MSMRKGQVLLITVFVLTFALFILLSLLSPIRDKIIRIKEMESIYQAVANAEKGIEASLLDVYKGENLNLNKGEEAFNTQICAGLTIQDPGDPNQNLTGSCYHANYTPKIGNLWTKNDSFRADVFIFSVTLAGGYGETLFKMKNIADGYLGKNVRTMLMGSGR